MKKVFKLEDLDCANCAAKMENAIGKLPGVQSVTVSFLTRKSVLVKQFSPLSADICAMSSSS